MRIAMWVMLSINLALLAQQPGERGWESGCLWASAFLLNLWLLVDSF